MVIQAANFLTLEHIDDESLMHADLNALDMNDDGYKNSSSIPKEYRQYNTGLCNMSNIIIFKQNT